MFNNFFVCLPEGTIKVDTPLLDKLGQLGCDLSRANIGKGPILWTKIV